MSATVDDDGDGKRFEDVEDAGSDDDAVGKRRDLTRRRRHRNGW